MTKGREATTQAVTSEYLIVPSTVFRLAVATAVLRNMRPTQPVGGIWMCMAGQRNLDVYLETYVTMFIINSYN